MSIDYKSIDYQGLTVLSNNDSGKIALLVESTTAGGVGQAMKKY